MSLTSPPRLAAPSRIDRKAGARSWISRAASTRWTCCTRGFPRKFLGGDSPPSKQRAGTAKETPPQGRRSGSWTSSSLVAGRPRQRVGHLPDLAQQDHLRPQGRPERQHGTDQQGKEQHVDVRVMPHMENRLVNAAGLPIVHPISDDRKRPEYEACPAQVNMLPLVPPPKERGSLPDGVGFATDVIGALGRPIGEEIQERTKEREGGDD